MLLTQAAQNFAHLIQRLLHEIWRCPRRMDSPGRGETPGLCKRARAFIGDCAPWEKKIHPQEVQVPVPRAVGDERFESREAGRAGTLSISVPAAVPAATPPGAPASELEELQKHLPKGSVYLWAAMVDGTAATDAIAGWVILMAQISCYILILVNSPKRSLEQFQDASVIHEPVEKYPTSEDTLLQGGSEFSTYTIDGATFIETRHSTEPISYALTSISAAVYLVVTFAAADLRAAIALLQTRKLYNKVLGAAILASFVLLVLASLSILFFLANDNASFIVGAAAVLFISDLDEKLWTALQTVSTRSRLFWCIEAFAVSLVLAIAGIAWFGNTVATSANGIGAMVKGTESETVYYLFETAFVFLIVPIGATVGAWGIALFLQYVAERHTRADAVRPRNLGNFLVLNGLIIVQGSIYVLVIFLVREFLAWLMVLSLAAPLVLSAAAGVVMCFPCCTKFLSRGRLKMLVGISVGFGISVGHIILFIIMYSLGSEEGSWTVVEFYVVVAFTAAISLFLAVSVVKAIGQSFESYPADMRALTWRLSCGQYTDSAANPDNEADPTVFGTALVVWSLYTCAIFVIVLLVNVRFQAVMF